MMHAITSRASSNRAFVSAFATTGATASFIHFPRTLAVLLSGFDAKTGASIDAESPPGAVGLVPSLNA